MMKLFVKVHSNIKRACSDGAIIVGRDWCERIKQVRFVPGRLGERKMYVHRFDVEYVITNPDRGYFYVDGPAFGDKGIQVDGWADGVRLLNNM